MAATEDDRFGEAALDYGLLSEQEARTCHERLAETLRTAPAATFAEVARALGILSALQIASIRELMRDPDAISAEPFPPDTSPSLKPPPSPPPGRIAHTPPLRPPRHTPMTIREPLPERALPGGFRPVSWLGRGPHGSVLLAEDAAAARRAIKIVPADPAAPEAAALLGLWGRLAALDHAGIVRPFDPERGDGELLLPSRAIEGLSLLQLAERVPITVERSCQIAIDACGALDSVHRLGLFHGNLKPENVMVSRTQETALSDFGMVWRAAAHRADHDPTGCPLRCLPPELIEGGAPTPASEVYGISAIVYELVVRGPLFSGTCDEVRQAILEGGPPTASARNPRVPEPIDAVLATGLARRPEERYPTPHDLAYDFNAFLHGSPVSARRLGLIARLWSLFGGKGR